MAVRKGLSADRRHAARRMARQGSKVFDQRFQRRPQLVFRCPADRPVRELRLCRPSEPRHCLCQSGVGQCRIPFGAPMSLADLLLRRKPFVSRAGRRRIRARKGAEKEGIAVYGDEGVLAPGFFACAQRMFLYCSYSPWNSQAAMPLADRSPPDRPDADLARPGRVAPGTRACPVVGGGHPGRRRPVRPRTAWRGPDGGLSASCRLCRSARPRPVRRRAACRGPDGDLSASRALRLRPPRTASARGDLARGGAGRYAFAPRRGGAAP